MTPASAGPYEVGCRMPRATPAPPCVSDATCIRGSSPPPSGADACAPTSPTRGGNSASRRFLGTGRRVHGAHVLIFATTVFTTPARNLGLAQSVALIDRDRLRAWLTGRLALSFVGATRR
ncbi:hypothetical protein [Embleya sp. NPDC020630]|uniref:hypothetical protein n=1 Tax=Embleya sp. NPDC020630 TaxID=3363979 RepID=UPI00378B5335